MKPMKKLISIFLMAMTWAGTSRAGLYLEPYVGYGTGKDSYNFVQTSPSSATVVSDINSKNMNYGGKVGYSFSMLALGADYMAESSGKATGSSVLPDETYTGSYIGAFVNLGLPFVKVSGTYFLSASAKNDDGSGVATFKGSGYKVGLGFTFLPLIAINVDYYVINFDKIDSPGSTFTSFKDDHKMTMVSVSLPINL